MRGAFGYGRSRPCRGLDRLQRVQQLERRERGAQPGDGVEVVGAAGIERAPTA